MYNDTRTPSNLDDGMEVDASLIENEESFVNRIHGTFDIYDSPPSKSNRSEALGEFGSVESNRSYSRQKIQLECDFYLDKDTTVDHGVQPLEWWNKNKHIYPNVARLAQKWLSVPATSTASERVFSDCGIAVTAKRSCLTGEAVQNQVLVRRNLKNLEISDEELAKILI